MNYLEEKKIDESYAPEVDATGIGTITKFTSKEFGGTFSRVIKIVHETVVVGETTWIDESGTPQTVPSLRMPCERVKDSIIIGRFTTYPNNTRNDWRGMQESALTPPALGFGSGDSPFLGFEYQGFDLAVTYNFLSSPIAVGDKLVVQLLFIEL